VQTTVRRCFRRACILQTMGLHAPLIVVLCAASQLSCAGGSSLIRRVSPALGGHTTAPPTTQEASFSAPGALPDLFKVKERRAKKARKSRIHKTLERMMAQYHRTRKTPDLVRAYYLCWDVMQFDSRGNKSVKKGKSPGYKHFKSPASCSKWCTESCGMRHDCHSICAEGEEGKKWQKLFDDMFKHSRTCLVRAEMEHRVKPCKEWFSRWRDCDENDGQLICAIVSTRDEIKKEHELDKQAQGRECARRHVKRLKNIAVLVFCENSCTKDCGAETRSDCHAACAKMM